MTDKDEYDPIRPDRLPQTTEERKQGFMQYQKSLSQYPENEKHFHRTTLRYVKNGVIPWNRSGEDDDRYTPEGYNDTWGIHGSYFITIFISTACDAVLMERYELRAELEEKKNWEPTGNYPSDGSKGQARTANRHTAKTYQWFLCVWDGEWESENH